MQHNIWNKEFRTQNNFFKYDNGHSCYNSDLVINTFNRMYKCYLYYNFFMKTHNYLDIYYDK